MAWTTPRTWVHNEVVTAAVFNTHIRDNLNETIGSLTRKNSSILRTSSGSVIEFGGISSVIDAAGAVDNGNTTLTASYVNMVTSSYTVTSGWTTFTAVLLGWSSYNGGNNSSVVQGRIGDGTSWGGTPSIEIDGSLVYGSLFTSAVLTGLSGNKTFAIQARFTDGGTAAAYDHGLISALAYRET